MSFNIRVYGILINAENQVLVTDEEIADISFTKFPGGGLEYGEGLKECLHREFLEELKVPIIVEDLFYLTEHFQPSAFSNEEQVISIYYSVSISDFNRTLLQFNPVDSKEVPRWIYIEDLNEADFMFPIDKMVVKKLLDTLR